jgi:hypothetical protein
MINGILSPENIKALAEIEREMDSGKQPFVRDNAGRRSAFPQEVLEVCGCVSGQTASEPIVTALLLANRAHIQMQIALEKVGK